MIGASLVVPDSSDGSDDGRRHPAVGYADRFAVDRDASWAVGDSERFLPPDWGNSLVQSISPKGSWVYGLDDLRLEEPQCYWNTASWERTCIELESGEAVGLIADLAWSPDESSFVVPTYLREHEARGVARLLLVETETGTVSTLLDPAATTHIHTIAFSPDGTRIAFVQITDGQPIRLQRIDLTGENLRTLVTASDELTLSDAGDLRWTADNHLVFYSGPFESDTQAYWRVRSDGSGLARITAVTPGESSTGEVEHRILDVSPDGRLMIAEGAQETAACGPELFNASWFIVDLTRDELVQPVCAVYRREMPGSQGVHLHPNTRVSMSSAEPSFLPDNSVLVRLFLVSGALDTVGLGLIDTATGRLSVVSSDLSWYADLWAVSSAFDDGSVRVWVGGYWRDQLTLAPVEA